MMMMILGVLRVLANGLADFKAVHFRHADIEQDNLWMKPRNRCKSQRTGLHVQNLKSKP